MNDIYDRYKKDVSETARKKAIDEWKELRKTIINNKLTLTEYVSKNSPIKFLYYKARSFVPGSGGLTADKLMFRVGDKTDNSTPQKQQKGRKPNNGAGSNTINGNPTAANAAATKEYDRYIVARKYADDLEDADKEGIKGINQNEVEISSDAAKKLYEAKYLLY